VARDRPLEREDACALNARLSELAEQTVQAIERAIRELGLTSPVYLSQNHGTLMSADFAQRYPVLTFASRRTNSMHDAAYLSRLRDAIVIDIGDTTTGRWRALAGFPREAGEVIKVAGVRTNFRMPDLFALGLGGGSLARADPLRIGPESVGYRLTEAAVVFGGSTFTVTDAAVAASGVEVGEAARLGAAEQTLAPAGAGESCRERAR
jgi:N-methylhydantoinase A/oxoprolinase/acetone carboxylase beta subunit